VAAATPLSPPPAKAVKADSINGLDVIQTDARTNGGKIRNLFVVPDAEKRNFFYGINFELSYETPPFSQTPWALEIRPIIGVRNKDWEFIVNPIVYVDFSATGQTVFAPALRLARNLGEDQFVGMEYYENLGRLGNDQLYAVTDFKLGKIDVELGIGYGLTPESDRLVTKAIIGFAFPVPGKSNADEALTISMTNPLMRRSSAELAWAPGFR
jgi:hypothetical protein